MASNLLKILNPTLTVAIKPNFQSVSRKGHHLRGKSPWEARSLQERLAELNYKDPEIYYKVDIGLPPVVLKRSEESRRRMAVLREKRKNVELEKLSRNNKVLINLDECKKDWLKTVGPYHIKTIAEHYGIFEHLFGDAYFHPRVPLSIFYEAGDLSHPVYYGNSLKPRDTSKKPDVEFECEKDSLWTLVMTNPDGHFTEPNSEYVHWFVGNIPGNQIEKGDLIVEYLQPFPPKGTGYQRLIFILYKQEKKLDFSSLKKEGACLTLSERTFSTFDFYKNRQDDLTPAGLAFFQSDWDSSLTEFYHNVLDMKEPVFEYDFPPPYIKPQKWFPLRQPFNLYMDKYRDPKQINKEFLVKKLKKVHPFKPTEKPLPYPNAQPFDTYIPTWLQLEMTKERLKWGRINDIE